METNLLGQYSDYQLLEEMKKRNLLTNAGYHNDLLEELKQNKFDKPKIILSYGIPENDQECSRCRRVLDYDYFQYYQTRVTKKGHLQRANAVCKDCIKITNNELKSLREINEVPEKPEHGDICVSCEREWFGEWHLDHVGDSLNGWICSQCNMSKPDHRHKELNERKERDENARIRK